MIAELSDYKPQAPVDEINLADVVVPSPTPFRGRVLCLPASDEADEIATAMLAQLLEGRGITAIPFPAGATTHQTIVLVDPQPEDVIVLSAIPPFAFAQATTAARHLHSKFPKTALLIGIWGFAGDRTKAQERFAHSHPDRLFISMSSAVDYLTTDIQGSVGEGHSADGQCEKSDGSTNCGQVIPQQSEALPRLAKTPLTPGRICRTLLD